jgi:mannosyltransferase OCH1-like enzyme
MIPKNIWQTYEVEYEDLPKYLKYYSQTFINLNPDWKYNYHSAAQREKFVLDNFGQEWYKIFMECPINVMKADIWRYMVLYIHGGVFSDIDSICKKPLDSWTNIDYDLIVCEDGDDFCYCNGGFASTAKNETILYILNYVKNKLIEKKYNDKYFVFNTTGPIAFTKAIKEFKNSKVYCYSGKDRFILKEDAIEQLSASLEWNKADYINWQNQVKDFLNDS